jgi:indole-3-glycerol phosphate synthase
MSLAPEMKLSPILESILDHKRDQVRHLKRIFPLATLMDSAERNRGERGSLAEAIGSGGGPSIIAEIKRSSPGQCYVPTGFDPVAIAKGYEAAGAVALSVLTEDRFFMGSAPYIPMVKKAVSIPVLRKDFIVDPWQIAESAALGADAVLLMAALFSAPEEMIPYYDIALQTGIEILMEIHTLSEWEMASNMIPDIVGINNRDFRSPDLDLDIETTVRLAPALPEDVTVISESGLSSASQLGRLASLGVDGFLIGSAFMKTGDPAGALRDLIAGA